MASLLQANLNRSRTTDSLLSQICHGRKSDILLVSEPYRVGDGPGWFQDAIAKAAIWIPSLRRFPVQAYGSGRGFVRMTSRNVTYVSCYLTPNDSIREFWAKMDDLEDALLSISGELIVAGDFNAKVPEWGEQPDSRGE